MNLFRKLFGRKSGFVGDFIETGDGLLSLIQSNQIAAAEFKEFESAVVGLSDESEILAQAQKSADALSGYGISVKSEAFVEILE